MKKLLILIVLISSFSVAGYSQFKIGAGAALLTDGGFFGVGAKGHYTFTEEFAGQASFTYYLEDATVWTLDLDVHYNGFGLGDIEGFNLTPFAGLNIFNVSANTGLGFSVGSSSTNINVGVNGTIPITDALDLYVEPKIIIGNGGTFGIAAGVYF